MFIVVIVIVMVTLAGATFVLTLSTEHKAAHIRGDQIQLEHVIASGQEWMKAICEEPFEVREEAGGLVDNAELFQSIRVPGADESYDAGSFSVLSPVNADSSASGFRYGVQDESAKLNLAVLLQWEREHPGAAAGALLQLPGMTESMADAILDWIDSDDSPRQSGAEEGYYSGRGLPYSPRNGIPVSLDELLLVRDISRFRLFGADRDLNYEVDRDELSSAAAQPGGAIEASDTPWSELLTMYGAERNASADGQPRIYLNEGDLATLHAQLGTVFDDSWGEFIVAYRQFGPYDEKAKKSAASRSRKKASRRSSTLRGRHTRGPQLDLSVPARFSIESVLDLIGVQVLMADERELETDEEFEQYTLESPFSQDTSQMAKYLPELLDHATTNPDDVIYGRVNVNLAPRAVLLAVPGMDPKVADQILSTRPGSGGEGASTLAWMLTEDIVDLGGMKSLLPYVTARGDVFRAQIVANSGTSALTTRGELVLDATTSPVRQLYWKDLSLLGRGFSVSTGDAGVADMVDDWQ